MDGTNPSDPSDPVLACEPAFDDHPEAKPGDLTYDIPPPKRYAHHGKRRRRFTEELFRCQHVDKISRSDLVCNALLWRNRPEALRAHLQEHIDLDQIAKMSDDEVTNWYTEAKRIFLAGIPEDEMDNEEDEQEAE